MLIRWIGVIGQAVALFVVHVGFGLDLPMVLALGIVGVSALLNLVLALSPPSGGRIDHRQATLPDQAGAFDLHLADVVGDEGGAVGQRRLRIGLRVDAVAHVDIAAGDVFPVGIGAFVHRVAGDRGRRAALPRMHGGDVDVFALDAAQDRLLAHERLGAE